MRHSISAVHDDDLQEFLTSLGVLRDLELGALLCRYCDQPISLENLYAVYPENNGVHVACDRPSCVRALHSALFNR